MIYFWMLVLSIWVGLLILILHDATKDDSDGGVIRVAAKASGIAIDRATRKMHRLREALHHDSAGACVDPGRGHTGESSWERFIIFRPNPPATLTEQAHAIPPKRKPWRKDGRVSCTIAELELNITEAVQKAAPECEGFLGVILKKTIPRSRRDANWQVQGVKFGKADRKIAGEALTTIIERMRKDFSIAEG